MLIWLQAPYNPLADIAPFTWGLIFSGILQVLKQYNKGSILLSGETLIEIDIVGAIIYLFGDNVSLNGDWCLRKNFFSNSEFCSSLVTKM